jgi:VanZ family protein
VVSGGSTRREPGWLSLWLPVLAVCALIFTLSSFSQLPSPPSGITDKHEHFAIYFLLGVTFVRALAGGRWAGVTPRVAMVALLFVSLYGASDEFHQGFVPGRDSSVLDWAADSIGALAAAGVLLAWAIIRRARTSDSHDLRQHHR